MTPTDNKKTELEEKLSQIKKREEEGKAELLAQKANLPYLNLIIMPISPEDVAFLPEDESRKAEAAIIKKTDRDVFLAIKNPGNPETQKIIEELKEKGFNCHIFVVSLSSLKKAWERYKLIAPEKVSLKGILNIEEKDLETAEKIKESIGNLSTSQLLSIIIAASVKMKASDIHLEPTKKDTRLRYRIDGILQDIASISQKQYDFLLPRVKTLSDMLLNRTDISQDGRFTVKIRNKESIDIRSSILPSNYGESIVLRLLGIAVAKLNLKELGMKPEIFAIVEKQINQPNGIILTTGPTGSGKTTTLYACLNYVNKPGTKIITVENPIEYQLEGVTQTQIEERKGHTFAKALRGIVRQDPDVLMVGEIRDEESAEIAAQFSLTGHLVFSTLHTNDAVGAIPRLIGMGVEPSSLSSSLKLVIAQRLVRRLCPGCKEKDSPSEETIKAVKKIVPSPPDKMVFYKPKGCSKCHGLGYQGRVGIFEIMAVNEEIEKLILNKATSYQLKEKARENGMLTLMEDALIRAAEGITSLEEIERVVGSPILAAKEIK